MTCAMPRRPPPAAPRAAGHGTPAEPKIDQMGIDPAKIQQGLLAYQQATFIPPQSTIALPTHGVLGEAVLGHCPSAERIDLTRFWNWQDSPGDTAPAISPVTLPTTGPSITAGLTAPNSLGNLPSLINNVLQAPTPNTSLLQSLGADAAAQKDFSTSLTGAAQLAPLVTNAQNQANSARAQALHHYGATVPFASPPVIQLPPAAPGATLPADVLRYLGRELTLAPAAALTARATDPLAIVRSAGSSGPWQLAARVITATSATVTPADYDAIQCTPTSKSVVTLAQARLVPLRQALAAAGFYPASPLPIPTNSTQTAWATFTNVTGLVSGSTRLGDELSLLYSAETIASSVFASILDQVWDGLKFGGT